MELGTWKFTLTALLCALLVNVSAQDNRAKGDKAWEQGEIKTAVNAYDFIKDLDKDPTYLMKRGVGHYKLNYLKKAIRDFTQARKVGNKDPELFYYMAQVKQQLLEHEEAAFFYKEYIKTVGEKAPRAYRAKIELKNCLYAANHIQDESIAMINDFGDDVNTYYDEIYPIQSPRVGNTFYYSSNSNKKDMQGYSVALDKNGDWMTKKKFGVGVNTKGDDYIMDISPDGMSMLFTRMEEGEVKNKIYVSHFDQNDEQHVIELPDYLIFGAVDLQIVDRNTIAFASKELGGAGGYDLFTINYKNRIWSDPVNLGAQVNTEYDERSPYLSSDQEFIYFSSDRPYCYGGFDVYYYNFIWIDKGPRNLGQPINSPGDDLQYRLSTDGQLAIMSSNRKTGKGGFDIYMMYMKEPKPFPEKDMAQLEYITDYLKVPQSHLDKLKEKMAANEEVASTEETKDSSKEIETRKENEIEKEAETEKEVETEKETAATKTEAKEAVVSTSEKTVEEGIASVNEQADDKADAQKPLKENTIDVTETEPTVKPDKKALDALESKIAIAEDEKLSDSDLKVKNERDLQYTLLYEDRQDLQNKINSGKLLKLAKLLVENPDYKTHLIAYTDYREPGLPEFMQYNTLKRANLVAEILMNHGVSSDRIVIESMCDNYPLTRKEVAGKKNEEFLPLNKRVDFEIRDDSDAVLMNQTIENYKIPGYAMDRKYELYTHIRDEVYYSVEIANSDIIFKNAVLRLYSDIYIRRENAEALNRYYIGIYNSYEDAMKLKEELADSSAPYSKIVAFYNGSLISEDQIESLLKDYPELKEYASARD